MGFNKIKRTLNNYISKLNTTDNALKVVRSDSSHSLFNKNQMKDLNLWILHVHQNNIPISRRSIQSKINESFNIQTTERTCGNILKRLDKSKKVCQTKKSGYK